MALEQQLAVRDVAAAYFGLSDALHTKWLMDSVEGLPVDGRWHAQARGVLRDELQAQQRALVGQVLGSASATRQRAGAGAAWLARDDATLRYTLAMFADMRAHARPGLSDAVGGRAPPGPVAAGASADPLQERARPRCLPSARR